MFSPYGWIAIVIVVASLFGGTYMKGRADGKAAIQAQWDNDKDVRKIAEQAAVAGRLRANEAQAEAAAVEKSILKKGYDDEIAKVRADRANPVRLRLPASVCAGPASGSETDRAGSGNADVTGTVALSDAITSDLLSLMQEADEIVASCRVAQKFIVDNGMAP